MSKFRRFMTAKSVGNLILRILIMLAIPYAYLMICGLIFDKWLHLYTATSFIFWSLMAFWAFEIVLSVLSVIWFCKSGNGSSSRAVAGSKRRNRDASKAGARRERRRKAD